MSVFGHRGFKANYPENTLEGFDHCLATGCSGIETDVWLLKDKVAVVSHDPNTKRVFCHKDGSEADYEIPETDFSELKPLVDLELRAPLISFHDLLTWFVKNQAQGAGDQKIMLDIKIGNPPEILEVVFKEMYQLHQDWGFWARHVQLGVWHLDFLKYLNQAPYFQQIPNDVTWEVVNISFLWTVLVPFVEYSAWLDTADVKRPYKLLAVLLIYLLTWTPLFVARFVPLLRQHSMSLFSWTINWRGQMDYLRLVAETAQLQWGVISDHPDKAVAWSKSPIAHAELSWLQKGLAYGFDHFFHKPQQVLAAAFAAPVDPHHRHTLKRSKVGMYIFQWLQRQGWL